MKRERQWLVLVGMLVFAILVALILYDYLVIDKCIDAGGRWDVGAWRCDSP